MEDLQVEDFNDPIEHKDEQTADGIKTPENQENDEELLQGQLFCPDLLIFRQAFQRMSSFQHR